MEGTSGRRIRFIFTERREKRPWRLESSVSCESAARAKRGRRRCQRYGWIGSAGETNRASTRRSPPKRIGHREMPGPPVSWSRVQARRPRARRKPRRDAGNTRGTGTRSRSSGKQKSVVRILFRAPGRAARHAVGGRTSSKQAVVALTRTTVGSKKGLSFGWSQKLAEKVCGKAALQRRVYKHASERNGAQVAIHTVKRVARALGPV